jgi:hypothetical protein
LGAAARLTVSLFLELMREILMPLMGHFRPIQPGLAMSSYPLEADIRTAGIYEYTP